MDKTKLFERLMPLVSDIKWERLEDYLNFERSVAVESLVKCSDIKTINKLQGNIATIDSILSLPHDIKRRTSR